MIQRFTKKSLKNTPVEIEIDAIQYNGNSNRQEIESFVGRELKPELESETAYVAGMGRPIFSLMIPLSETNLHIRVMRGDWVIKNGNDISVCENENFKNTWDSLNK